MSKAKIVLGENWDVMEWPDEIEVSHSFVSAGYDLTTKTYVPEETCEVERVGVYVLHLTCGHRAVRSIDPAYCPTCGRRIVK